MRKMQLCFQAGTYVLKNTEELEEVLEQLRGCGDISQLNAFQDMELAIHDIRCIAEGLILDSTVNDEQAAAEKYGLTKPTL